MSDYTLFLCLSRQEHDDVDTERFVIYCPLGHWSVGGSLFNEEWLMVQAYWYWTWCYNGGEYNKLIEKFQHSLEG